MKRYKQAILSNFFVTLDDNDNHRHLVEANLDIESRDDRALCTEVLHKVNNYTVLTNELISSVCPICTAIMIRAINNMPQEKKNNIKPTETSPTPETQLSLSLFEEEQDQSDHHWSFQQFELII